MYSGRAPRRPHLRIVAGDHEPHQAKQVLVPLPLMPVDHVEGEELPLSQTSSRATCPPRPGV